MSENLAEKSENYLAEFQKDFRELTGRKASKLESSLLTSIGRTMALADELFVRISRNGKGNTNMKLVGQFSNLTYRQKQLWSVLKLPALKAKRKPNINDYFRKSNND
jgi:hypothetical protein